MTYEDLEHYSKVVTALQEMLRLTAAIDAVLRLSLPSASLRAVSDSRTAIPTWPLE